MNDCVFNLLYFGLSFIAGSGCLLVTVLSIKNSYKYNTIFEWILLFCITVASFVCFFMSYLIYGFLV